MAYVPTLTESLIYLTISIAVLVSVIIIACRTDRKIHRAWELKKEEGGPPPLPR